MVKYIYIICLLLLSTFLHCGRENNVFDANQKSGLTKIKGKISNDLLLADSPFLVIEDITIDSSMSVSIEAGVQILFSSGTKFFIYGNAAALGTKDQPIKFTGYSNVSWNGIEIISSSQSEFKFCIIENIKNDVDTISKSSIYILDSKIKFSNCIFRNNSSKYGGGLYIYLSVAEIKNCLFIHNFALSTGGAILSEMSNVEIINNSFYKNSSFNYAGGLFVAATENSIIQNNIFFKNTSKTGDPRIELQTISGTADTAYNFLAYGSLNPFFISEDNFHLKENSPCIDTGNPDELFNDYDGTRNDVGAYGGPLGNW